MLKAALNGQMLSMQGMLVCRGLLKPACVLNTLLVRTYKFPCLSINTYFSCVLAVKFCTLLIQ